MITKNDIKFVRFGGLSPVEQTHYKTGDDKTFHNPPRKKGVYAFVYGYIETFLIGATMEPDHISNKSMWLKDDDGNRIEADNFFDHTSEYDDKYYRYEVRKEWKKFIQKKKIKLKDIREQDGYVTVLKKPKVFTYYGDIWHHLGNNLHPHQIIETSGSWVKTSMDDYIIALNTEIRLVNKEKHKMSLEINIKDVFKGRQDPFKPGIGVNFSKDHLEVFIEKI
jgi:hypothetical protein